MPSNSASSPSLGRFLQHSTRSEVVGEALDAARLIGDDRVDQYLQASVSRPANYTRVFVECCVMREEWRCGVTHQAGNGVWIPRAA